MSRLVNTNNIVNDVVYRRIISEHRTPEQNRVWEANHNSLIYHMTTTDRWMGSREIHGEVCAYAFDYPSPGEESLPFTRGYVEDALDTLVAVGMLEKGILSKGIASVFVRQEHDDNLNTETIKKFLHESVRGAQELNKNLRKVFGPSYWDWFR